MLQIDAPHAHNIWNRKVLNVVFIVLQATDLFYTVEPLKQLMFRLCNRVAFVGSAICSLPRCDWVLLLKYNVVHSELRTK